MSEMTSFLRCEFNIPIRNVLPNQLSRMSDCLKQKPSPFRNTRFTNFDIVQRGTDARRFLQR